MSTPPPGLDHLPTMVADLLGHASVDLDDATIEPVEYDVPSLTTVARHWVCGAARTPRGEEQYRLFVKQVQAVQHSPVFEHIPLEIQEMVRTAYPWNIEGAVYRSDLARRLPRGLAMPRAVGVFDTDPDSTTIWLEAIPARTAVWSLERYERAAYLLGRLSASATVRDLSDVGEFRWNVTDYVNGRLQLSIIPQIESEAAWQHPQFTDLQHRMRVAASRAHAYGRELLGMPHLASHGDASPNNLLAGRGSDEFVLIDFGLWLSKPVGFDLGQLVAGEAQLGRVPGVDFAALDEHCVLAFARGLAEEGCDIDVETVRRAHALQLFLFSGISTLPEAEMPVEHIAARALLARHSLDLLDRTP